MQDYEAVAPEPEIAGLEYQCKSERSVDPHFCIEEEPGGDDDPIGKVSEPPADPPP